MDGPRAAPLGDRPNEAPPRVTREIAAEAAVWVARLHGPGRSRGMERECLAWQARSPLHRHAFERCTETWMDVPRVTVAGAFAAVHGSAGADRAGEGVREADRRPVLAWGLVLLVGAAVAGLVWQPWHAGDAYRTGVGETQSLVLADGTRLSLNTDTRLRVDFRASRRAIQVERGEALFEVARDAQRPFVVRAGGSEVVALGTVFSVRLNPPGSGPVPGAGPGEALAVTLVEGQVSLQPVAGGPAGQLAPAQALHMAAGERVRLVRAPGGVAVAAPLVDRPRLEQVVAWTRSEASFDNVSLAEAVAEMNRYSRTPIVLASDLAQGNWRVSGQYRTGDNAGFARAVAALHGLALREGSGRLELIRAP